MQKIYLLFSLLLLLACAPCVLDAKSTPNTSAKIRQTSLNKINYLSLNDIARKLGMQLSFDQSRIYLKKGKIVFTFNNQKRYAGYNGTEISLLFAPYASKGSVWVSKLDYELVITPLLTARYMRQHKVQTICIDPGHGGNDPGCKNGKVYEKKINLEVALRLRAKLKALGYNVVMTRTTDRDLSLSARPEIAKKNKAQLFISIHCNSTKNKSVNGVETFAPTPIGAASTSDKTPRAIRYPSNAYDRNSFRLAFELQRGTKKAMNASDRGVKHARYVVIRDATMPAALVEIGFLSNTAEAKKMIAPAYQDQIANQIAQAVLRYHKSLK